jgi:hypothetical protein
MQLHRHLRKSVFGKAALAAVALGGFLFLAGAPNAQAREFRDRPVARYDNFRVHEAVERHGYYSPQANYWRYERREAFEHGWRDRFGCWHRY